MLVLVQELALLQNFESKDVALAFKLNKSQTEKAEVVGSINDCQLKLTAKKKVRRANRVSIYDYVVVADGIPPMHIDASSCFSYRRWNLGKPRRLQCRRSSLS